jgi:methionine-rich copper-binding protein CopC
MLRIFSLAYTALFILGSSLSLSAADAPTELTMKSVNVIDSTKIRISFSDSIDMTSIVLKISKQSDNSAIAVGDLQSVKNAPESIDVSLNNELEEWSSYTLTVQAAIGTSGSTIIDGAGALREFVTPSPLKKSEPSLNAPANPSAILVKNADVKKETVLEQNLPSSTSVDGDDPAPTEELPLTGMNPLFFLILILPIAYILLRRKVS